MCKMQFAQKNYDYFVMVGPGSDYGHQMWKDLEKIDNCFYSPKVLMSKNVILNFLHHFHFSFFLNKLLTIPFQNVWDKKNFLSSIDWEASKRYCVVLTDISACRTSVNLLRYLHSKSNIEMVLVNVNIFSSKKKILTKRLPFFNRVYTFDKGDSERLGWFYYSKFYSSDSFSKRSDETFTYDAFFVGTSKGRSALLSGIADKMASFGLRPCFYIVGAKKQERISKNVIYNKRINYEKVLTLANNSKCIVEVLAEGQKGATLRYVEAVCLNKLLMTTNKEVCNEKYFESGNISIFSCVEDFDIDFIKKHHVSNYNYSNDFSPIHFLEKISE